MLSWDGAAKAWNVLEWNFSFSIGDGVMLVVALATTMIAFLTEFRNNKKPLSSSKTKLLKGKLR